MLEPEPTVDETVARYAKKTQTYKILKYKTNPTINMFYLTFHNIYSIIIELLIHIILEIK